MAWGDDGRSDFGRLFSRLHSRSGPAHRQAKTEFPITWVAFDLCYLDGASFLDQPYRSRRAALEDLDLSGPSWHTTPASLGEGLAMLRAAREYDLEGVVVEVKKQFRIVVSVTLLQRSVSTEIHRDWISTI